MRKVKTKNVKILVPEKLGDIKLSQYMKYIRVTEGLEDVDLINRRLVAVFCNLTDTIVNNMTKQSYNEILLHLTKLLDVDKDMELIRTFKHKGETYGFIPNMDDMTVGELADADTYLKDRQKMDKLIGVLYRPTKAEHRGNYKIEDYKPDVSIDAPLDVALSAYFFLFGLMRDLLSCIPNCIKAILKQDPKIRGLVENMGGLSQFTDLLSALCLDISKTLQPLSMEKAYSG